MQRKVSVFTVGRIIELYDTGVIDLEVWYQRQPGKWDNKKRSDFIGGLLNNFSCGSLFYHKYENTNTNVLGQVDGKQRVSNLVAFRNGEVRLPFDYVYEANPLINISNFSWQELADHHAEVLNDLLSKEIVYELLITDDVTKVYEQFVRLNSGKQLKPAEIRHGLPGVLMDWVRQTSHKDTGHAFVRNKLGFTNDSYQHEDFVLKVLYMEMKGTLTGLNSKHLNVFASSYANPKRVELKALRAAMRRVEDVFDMLADTFADNNVFDRLNAAPPYYWLARYVINHDTWDWSDADLRIFFDQFVRARAENNKSKPAYKNEALTHYALLMQQALVREEGIKDRYTILQRFAQVYNEEGEISVETEVCMEDLITYSNSEFYLRTAV